MAIHKQLNTNEVALFAPNTKWKGNELPSNDLNLNCVALYIDGIRVESNGLNRLDVTKCVTIIDDCAQTRVKSDTVKLFPFQVIMAWT